MTEKGNKVSVKCSIVLETHIKRNLCGTLPGGDQFAGEQKPFFQNIFFRCFVKLAFEFSEKIALADVKTVGDFPNTLHVAQIIVDVIKRVTDQRGNGMCSVNLLVRK